MEYKITHFNRQLSSSGFQQTAKHLKICLPSLNNLQLEDKTEVRQMLKGFFVIIVGPWRLALEIQEKCESSLIIMVTTWKQKKSYKTKSFSLSAESIEYFGQKKKEQVHWFTKPLITGTHMTLGVLLLLLLKYRI